VRRVSAISLLVALSFSLIAPALFADPESKLPECCRRKGAHQCSMGAQDSAPSDGMAFRVAARCPSCPVAPAVATDATAAPASSSGAVFASLVSHPSVQPQSEAHYRVSFSRSRQKRGPPAIA
jgi:hypothetical protein